MYPLTIPTWSLSPTRRHTDLTHYTYNHSINVKDNPLPKKYMASYLFNHRSGADDGYETIPLMNDGDHSNGSSQSGRFRPHTNNQSSTSLPTLVQQHFKKILAGCVVVMVCVLFFAGPSRNKNHQHGTEHQEKRAEAVAFENALTLTPRDVAHPDTPPLPKVGDKVNFTDTELSQEYLRQFLEVYPNGDDAKDGEEESSSADAESDDNEHPTNTNTAQDEVVVPKFPEVVQASILDWHIDNKDADSATKAAGADDERDVDEDAEKPNKKAPAGKKKAGGRRRRRRGGSGGKKNKKNGDTFDLSALKAALRTNSENPFTVDYHTLVERMASKHTSTSGDIDAANDYSLRDFSTRQHKGHLDEKDLELFHSLRFFHISDTHIDSFFNPYQSSQQGVCASCKLNSKIYGEAAYCPLESPFKPNLLNTKAGYHFGRYRCNPPPQLLASMLANIRTHQRTPAFFLITGDIGAHGLPTDGLEVTPGSTLLDFCPTKFNGMRETLTMFRELFPDTPILFSPGNNDHLPKNKVWTPYFEAFAALLVEFQMLHPSQAATFSRIGSHYVDLEVDNTKYIEFITAQAKNSTNTDVSKKMTQGLDKIPETTLLRAILPDMTLLAPGGEVSFVDESEYAHLEGLERENVEFPKRAELIRWLNETLFEADKAGRFVLLGGHQPLTTKKGSNELLLTSTTHGLLFKALLAQYAHRVTSSFFGHRNLASISSILSPSGDHIIPSLTIPGVSPRGLNQPAFMELALSRTTGTVLDFEQFVFDLMEENERAQLLASSMREYIPTDVLIAGTSADSGSAIVHEVIAARVSDRYDPEEYAKHKAKEAAEAETPAQKNKDKQEQKGTTELTQSNLVSYGIDCGNDEELCAFVKKWGYLGRWVNNPEDIATFRKMTGAREFTAATVFDMNSRIPTSGKLYTALQVFKRAGLIGDSSPEAVWCQSLYDDENMMMKCLFPEQDETEGCFAKSWMK